MPKRANKRKDAMIKLERVEKRYGQGPYVLAGIDLEVARGSTMALVGPSGCGKTTTLKLINRLVRPTGGRVLVDGHDIAQRDVAELRRGIGYVVQEAGLFPHMTAAENVDVVPRLLGFPAERRERRRRELFELLGLEHGRFADRYPLELSGGQRQRVGLARALAANPEVLLMDEPFGALDPVIRRRLQREFIDLKSKLGKTVVIVTHDMEEAFLLADQVAILRRGALEQLGSPAEIKRAPASDFVRQMLGHEVTVDAGDDDPAEETVQVSR
ncbi:MAG: ATP-binding cassette domain-containing protein [Myxococcales bacterium]|nr:ATP-binding cassette domain-containing protein [Myxococcales bacterium]